MFTVIMVLVVLGGIGAVFGFILAFANRKFAMEVNPLIHEVEDILPKGQCGACGYAGCAAYAEAVVINAEVPPNLCVPGKDAVAKLVAEITGKKTEEVEPKVAHVRCKGSVDKAKQSYRYKGIKDCKAAILLQGGPKECKHGCIGFGTCVNNCPFGALTIGKEGLPVVDISKCTGCGKCESSCPKNVIELISVNSIVEVNCNSKDKGAIARKICSAGACLGCGICAKNCNYGAIEIKNNLAVVNTQICLENCKEATCIAKCPTGAIKAANNLKAKNNSINIKATI
ncbi:MULTISPECIES: RnfABCDGE type electron transport complex subunit B [unclassified Clostridium]|uniref:RnfABCDGE type electron transport complex subunit B n=1 Tax=unclassified Clostridium TaxID=2614128 RepID=UPI000297C421|nr:MULTISPECIES: Fe-S cluster domain-containing protein [unclassified Clostridium]EKQ57170.1 MAG: electron transport complex, RnfABCDGE type, B subunit [Clostridium sp. Maddingley MBC34-26]